jgi:hypothetical protein
VLGLGITFEKNGNLDDRSASAFCIHEKDAKAIVISEDGSISLYIWDERMMSSSRQKIVNR